METSYEATCAAAEKDNVEWWTWAIRALCPWKTSRSSPSAIPKTRIELREENVYMVRAREGLEGHFLVFRVLYGTEDGFQISYLFR